MGKIQLVIEIEERLYKNIIDNDKDDEEFEAMDMAFCNAKPLPKGHGRLIDADKCLNLAWQNLYKHEDEMEKKIEDYLPIKRFHEQRGFEVCQQTLVNAMTIIEADKEVSDG